MKKVTSQVITFRIPFKKKVKNFKLDSKKYILRNIKKSFLVEVKVPHFLEEGYRNIEISNRINNIGKEMVKIISEKMRKDKYAGRIKL
jgi:hypothetical protein